MPGGLVATEQQAVSFIPASSAPGSYPADQRGEGRPDAPSPGRRCGSWLVAQRTAVVVRPWLEDAQYRDTRCQATRNS